MNTNEVKATPTTAAVTSNDGKRVVVEPMSVPVEKVTSIYNFVEAHRKDYFEDHSMDWALDEIITRGIAEITRQVKTQVKAAENRAAGSLLKEFNMTPEQAKALLAQLKTQATANAKA
jgi:hypothetical protein